MSDGTRPGPLLAAPGTERPRRYLPKLRYELVGCGLHGHELLGTDAAALRAENSLFARDSDGLRWYRCLRCDSWVALCPPERPQAPYPPSREQISLPLRGTPLRDRYVLRLIDGAGRCPVMPARQRCFRTAASFPAADERGT